MGYENNIFGSGKLYVNGELIGATTNEIDIVFEESEEFKEFKKLITQEIEVEIISYEKSNLYICLFALILKLIDMREQSK